MNFKFSTIIFFVSLSITALSQKTLELKDVVGSRIFAQKSVTGLRSLNDGLHYTTHEEGKRIIKYSYKTGTQVEILFDLSKIENICYKFSLTT